MKNSKNIGMLAAVVFAVGMVGFNLSDGTISLIDDVPLATMEGGMLSGHLEIIHADSDGNILSYQQTGGPTTSPRWRCFWRATARASSPARRWWSTGAPPPA